NRPSIQHVRATAHDRGLHEHRSALVLHPVHLFNTGGHILGTSTTHRLRRSRLVPPPIPAARIESMSTASAAQPRNNSSAIPKAPPASTQLTIRAVRSKRFRTLTVPLPAPPMASKLRPTTPQAVPSRSR